MEINMDNYP